MAFQPVKWDKRRLSEFTEWLRSELENTLGDRSALDHKWRDLIVKHRARVVGDGVGSVPFEGASDLDYPLTSIHFEPVYADLMQTLHIPRDFWSITPLRPDAVPSAKPLQEFLSLVERNDIRMRHVNQKAFLDLIVLGTTIYKSSIFHHAKTVNDYDPSGAVGRQTKLIFKPEVSHVPLQDFYIPAYSWRIDPDEVGGAPWVAHRFELTEGQLKARAQGDAPWLPNYDKKATQTVLEFIGDLDEGDTVKEEQRAEDSYLPWRDRKAKLYEVWARFPTSTGEIDDDIVVVWHQETGTILRTTHNPFVHGRRPFYSAPYVPSFGFYGVGLGEADEWAQIAMTRLLNNVLDSTYITNSKMYAVPAGAPISFDESVYSGKFWPVLPGEEVKAIPMGDTNPSVYQIMDRLKVWADQRTSVNELRQGNMANMPDRTPAATTLSMMQESNKKFDMVLANLREDAMAGIGQTVLQNLVQISRDDPRYAQLAVQVLGQADARAVLQVLGGPVHDIEDRYGVTISATSSQINKEVEKQSQIGLAQLVAQMYPQQLQYAQALAQMNGDPSLIVATLQAGFNGQTELMRRLLESFDIQNPEIFLPEGQGQGQQGAPGAAAPAPPATAPLGGPGGAAPLAQGAGTLEAMIGI